MSFMEDVFVELLKTRSALLADVEKDARDRLLLRSDLTGTMQLYELTSGEGLRQLTALSEPVGAACYLARSRRAVIEVDRGGNERHQLYLVDSRTDRASSRPGSQSCAPLPRTQNMGIISLA